MIAFIPLCSGQTLLFMFPRRRLLFQLSCCLETYQLSVFYHLSPPLLVTLQRCSGFPKSYNISACLQAMKRQKKEKKRAALSVK